MEFSIHYKKPRAWLLIVSLAALIVSCHTPVKKKDGPPPFYVDETKIHDAVPKPEPLAKFGNMPSYRVFGTRYYVMRSNHHYEAVGTASWYGTLFHKRRTSSGEPYDMLGMTAAHKTLPLPTYVEVTNLANRRKVIVKVNDRGPFSGNRLIDLSYVAAKKLGMLAHGTAYVRVRVIDPFIKKVIAKKNTNSYHSIYLQVGAFRNKVNALKLKQRLLNIADAPIIISNAKSSIYRVQIGPIQDHLTADKITSDLHSLGIKPKKTDGA